MKALALFSVSLFSLLSLSAQVPVTDFVGDTLGPWTVISFEEPTPYIQNSSAPQNIWRTGIPQKSFFSQAYTVPNAMVTDTANFYPENNQSFFDLYIGDFNNNYGLYLHDLFIDFRHKYDTDTLHDGGFITVSWDHGQSWMNILEDTLSMQFCAVSPARQEYMYGNSNIYALSDTLYNGEHGYSGRSDGWVKTCMAWYDIPCRDSPYFPPDTMILRFNFISDNIHHNREGWMIDQIRIYSIDLGSGIREYLAGNKRAFVAPNPVRISATVTFDKTYDHVNYLVTDLAGRSVLRGIPGKCSTFRLGRANLSPGIYLLRINFGEDYSESHRVIITD